MTALSAAISSSGLALCALSCLLCATVVMTQFYLRATSPPNWYRVRGDRVEGLAPGAEDLLKQYDWPGNVRQLSNVIKRAIILESGGVILHETI